MQKRASKKGKVTPKEVNFKRWFFRIVAVAIIPGIFISLLELVLRIINVGYSHSFLLEDSGMIIDNPRFSWRFFPISMARYPEPQRFSPFKPPNTVRILIFGESAAQGDPLPQFGFPRILARLLQIKYPEMRIEVINLAYTAINSHVIRYISEAARKTEADIWLFYIGNNEVVGPYGAGTVLGIQAAPSWLIKLHQRLLCSKIGQLIFLAVNLINSHSRGWEGMEMFIKHHIHADDPKLLHIYKMFERNLEEMVNNARLAKAEPILCTVAVNLADCAPFSSLSKLKNDPKLADRSNTLIFEAWQALLKGELKVAEQLALQSLQIDSTIAAGHYILGKIYLALDREKEAFYHLSLARDLDTLRFRADSKINATIRTVAQKTKAKLIDIEVLLNQKSVNGIAGEEFFLDHVHFNFHGNYVLALILADKIEQILQDQNLLPINTNNWATEEECKVALAYNSTYELTSLEFMLQRLERPPFVYQLDHERRVSILTSQIEKLRFARKPAGLYECLKQIQYAIERFPEDWRLYEMQGRVAAAIGERGLALASWTKVAEMLPHSHLPWQALGDLNSSIGKFDEAIYCYNNALKRAWWDGKSLEGIGLILARKGETKEAFKYFRRALIVQPELLEARSMLNELRRKTLNQSPEL